MSEAVEPNGQEEQPTMEEPATGEPADGVFPADYVRQLRAENARRRTSEKRLSALVAELAAQVGAAEEPEALLTRVKELHEQSSRGAQLAREVLLSTTFAQAARDRDVVDPDAAWRLMDTSGVTVDLESRAVTGLEEALEALLAARPYLVGRAVPAGSPGGGTPRASRPQTDDTLAGRVRRQFQRRHPGGLAVPAPSSGTLRIR